MLPRTDKEWCAAESTRRTQKRPLATDARYQEDQRRASQLQAWADAVAPLSTQATIDWLAAYRALKDTQLAGR